MAPLIKYDLSPREFHLGKSYALLNRSVDLLTLSVDRLFP